MEEAYMRLDELLQANHIKAVRTQPEQGNHVNLMRLRSNNINNNTNTNNNISKSNVEEEETSAWLQSMMDQDPFLRELWSDLFFAAETKIVGDGPSHAPAEHAATPERLAETKDPNNGGGGGSSSSTGSGTSEGVTAKKRKTAGGSRRERKGREHGEESDYMQTDEENESQPTGVGARARARGASSSRRSRSSEVHNMSERRRRDKINEKMKALQELLPHCNKADKASMLDEAIDYLKSLQLQVQMMWMAKGIAPVTTPNSQSHASFMAPPRPRLCAPKAEAPPNATIAEQILSSIGPRFSSLTGATSSQTHHTGTVFDMHARYLELQQKETNSLGAYGSPLMQMNPQNIQKWQDR